MSYQVHSDRWYRQFAEKVFSGDTVVIFPPERETVEGGESHGEVSEIFEKPIAKVEQVRSNLQV